MMTGYRRYALRLVEPCEEPMRRPRTNLPELTLFRLLLLRYFHPRETEASRPHWRSKISRGLCRRGVGRNEALLPIRSRIAAHRGSDDSVAVGRSRRCSALSPADVDSRSTAKRPRDDPHASRAIRVAGGALRRADALREPSTLGAFRRSVREECRFSPRRFNNDPSASQRAQHVVRVSRVPGPASRPRPPGASARRSGSRRRNQRRPEQLVGHFEPRSGGRAERVGGDVGDVEQFLRPARPPPPAALPPPPPAAHGSVGDDRVNVFALAQRADCPQSQNRRPGPAGPIAPARRRKMGSELPAMHRNCRPAQG